MNLLLLLAGAVAAIGGAIAALSGFGIGSVLTPLFAARYGARLAVALVSVPHVIATAVRYVQLHKHVDKKVFLNFGILSAAGGLLGALVNTHVKSPALAIAFGALLTFAGLSGLTGFVDRMHFGRRTAWFAGMLSGFFGGLVGNQGGIRSAALLGFDISKESLVATATAIGIIVDAARMPVYFALQGKRIVSEWALLVVATIGVLLGTFWGVRLLRRIPERIYRKIVYFLVLALGIYMLAHGIAARGQS